MKTNKRYIVLAALILFSAPLWAQQGSLKLNINYAVGIPTGNFKTITDKVSPRGWDAALMYNINDRLSAGLQTGYQDFYQKYPRQLIHQSGSDISAVISQSVQTAPVMAKVQYRFNAGNMVQPYVAVAAGGNFVNFKTYYGEFADSHSKFGFAAQPQAGIEIPVGANKRTAINIAAGYNIMPFQYGMADGLNHIVLKGGISIPIK